jgi:integrase
MPIEKLTDARLRGLKFEDGELIDARTGLSARADRTGKVSLSFRYRFGNTRPRIFLGTFPQLALVDARIEAGKIRETVRHGRDPQAERRSSTASVQMTFNDLADLYLARYARPSKASWKVDERMLALDVRPLWGKRSAAGIVRADATRLLFDVAARAPIGGNRLRTILNKLFGWAVDSGLLDLSPMLGVKRLTRESAGKTRALDDAEIGVLWRALAAAKERPEVVAALKVLLLLGQRPGEVAGMTTGELHRLDDAGGAFWQIPAARMKARRLHIVPLPPLAREIILAELTRPRRSEFVFPGRTGAIGRNSLSQALATIIEGLGEEGGSLKRERPTPHDFRRSAISGMARLGVPRDHRMAVAAHSYSDTHAVYDRHDFLDEKRLALTRWENHIRRIIAGETGGAEIVTLPSARLR